MHSSRLPPRWRNHNNTRAWSLARLVGRFGRIRSRHFFLLRVEKKGFGSAVQTQRLQAEGRGNARTSCSRPKDCLSNAATIGLPQICPALRAPCSGARSASFGCRHRKHVCENDYANLEASCSWRWICRSRPLRDVSMEQARLLSGLVEALCRPCERIPL